MVRVRVNGSIVYTVTQSVLFMRGTYDIIQKRTNQKPPKQTPKQQQEQQQKL